MTEPVWLPIDLMLAVHRRQLAEHGGLAGVRDLPALDSALARPLNAFSHGERDMCALASLYAAGVVKNHPFVDGNKRTGFVACELFLLANWLALEAPDEECIAMTIALAAGEADADAYAEWLRAWTKHA